MRRTRMPRNSRSEAGGWPAEAVTERREVKEPRAAPTAWEVTRSLGSENKKRKFQVTIRV